MMVYHKFQSLIGNVKRVERGIRNTIRVLFQSLIVSVQQQYFRHF